MKTKAEYFERLNDAKGELEVKAELEKEKIDDYSQDEKNDCQMRQEGENPTDRDPTDCKKLQSVADDPLMNKRKRAESLQAQKRIKIQMELENENKENMDYDLYCETWKKQDKSIPFTGGFANFEKTVAGWLEAKERYYNTIEGIHSKNISATLRSDTDTPENAQNTAEMPLCVGTLPWQTTEFRKILLRKYADKCRDYRNLIAQSKTRRLRC